MRQEKVTALLTVQVPKPAAARVHHHSVAAESKSADGIHIPQV